MAGLLESYRLGNTVEQRRNAEIIIIIICLFACKCIEFNSWVPEVNSGSKKLFHKEIDFER